MSSRLPSSTTAFTPATAKKVDNVALAAMIRHGHGTRWSRT